MLSTRLLCGSVVVTVTLLLLVPNTLAASSPPEPPRPAAALAAGTTPGTATSKPPTASTVRSGQENDSADSDPILPIVLAAIIFLAVLGPTSGLSHSHRHWHR